MEDEVCELWVGVYQFDYCFVVKQVIFFFWEIWYVDEN